ncbi:ATP-binding protein [Georgenia sp. TF02-10]|uniref:sensor histidine kinase n=1 Tax=Georgenia sp. TF02-10 TaxID=2917725 RepID=UPI001FA7AE74|nr:ATP-binding protein [Georgenia sp. TF02-10]UNX55346.1 ATP-binding protein [Georgenia sp. TF02-10]
MGEHRRQDADEVTAAASGRTRGPASVRTRGPAARWTWRLAAGRARGDAPGGTRGPAPERTSTPTAPATAPAAAAVDEDDSYTAPPRQRAVFLRQLPFAGLMLVVVVALLFYAPDQLRDQRIGAGLGVALAATVLALLVPWHRLPRRASASIPLLDMLAVALLSGSGTVVISVLVLPVLWLATVFRLGALVVGLVAASLAAWGPALLAGGISLTFPEVQRVGTVQLVLIAAGVTAYLSERRSRARRDLLVRQGDVVEEAVADAQAQQRLLDSILNTIDVGVVALDGAGRITLINRAHALLVAGRLRVGDHVTVHGGIDGYAADGATPLGAAGSPLVRAAAGEIIDRELTWWDHGPDEPARALRVSADQLYDADGTRRGAVVVYQDLTAEMAALAQREDFVSSVSHELRTPLTSVLGYLDLALDDPATPEPVRAHLAVAERNAERLLRLIGDLLTAARTRRGELELDRAPVDLAEVVAEAVQALAPRARQAGVALHVDAAPVTVTADRSRLRQVVDNVLSNAVKYTPAGGRVDVATEAVDGMARVRVRDTGIGIAPAEQAGLFDRFYRAPSVRHGRVVGAGLGLHISRQIVQAHGGTIELTSAPGEGTEVRIGLPAEPAAASTEASAGPAAGTDPSVTPAASTDPPAGPASRSDQPAGPATCTHRPAGPATAVPR